MRKFALGGLVTLLMLVFAALAQADGPTVNIKNGRCGVFDAAGFIWPVSGLHITSNTDKDGKTHLHCNATLPVEAFRPGDEFPVDSGLFLSDKKAVWDANAFIDGLLPNPLLVNPPDGAFNVIPDPDDDLIYCAIAGLARTTDWHDLVNNSGRSNASCSFDSSASSPELTPTPTPTPTATPTAAPTPPPASCLDSGSWCNGEGDVCCGSCEPHGNGGNLVCR